MTTNLAVSGSFLGRLRRAIEALEMPPFDRDGVSPGCRSVLDYIHERDATGDTPREDDILDFVDQFLLGGVLDPRDDERGLITTDVRVREDWVICAELINHRDGRTLEFLFPCKGVVLFHGYREDREPGPTGECRVDSAAPTLTAYSWLCRG